MQTLRAKVGLGVEEWMESEIKAEAGEHVCIEVLEEQWVEDQTGIAYEEVQSQVEAERRLKMLEKIMVDRLGEVNSVTGKIS